MNETVCFTSLGKRVAFYNPKPETASFPARKIIRINTTCNGGGRIFRAA